MEQRTGERRQNHAPAHVRLPSSLLYADLTPRARDLWAVVDDLARSAPGALVSVAGLAAALRCSARSVQRARAELVAGGWLVVDGAGGRGVPLVWRPQRRARPVDNLPERVPPVSPFLGVKGATGVTLSPRPYKEPQAREEEEPGCARQGCDRGWVETADGRVARCACSRPPSPF